MLGGTTKCHLLVLGGYSREGADGQVLPEVQNQGGGGGANFILAREGSGWL